MIVNHKDDGTGRNFLNYPGTSDEPPRMKEGAETVFSHDRPAVSVRCSSPSVDPELFYTSDGKLYLRRTWHEWFRVRITDMKHLVQLLKKPNTQLLEINERGEVTERSMGVARLAELPSFLFPVKKQSLSIQEIMVEIVQCHKGTQIFSDEKKTFLRTLSDKKNSVTIGSVFAGDDCWDIALRDLVQLYGGSLETRIAGLESQSKDSEILLPVIGEQFLPETLRQKSVFRIIPLSRLESELKALFPADDPSADEIPF